MSRASPALALSERIARAINGTPYRPWCVHRLYEELIPASAPSDRDGLLSQTKLAADALVREGRAVRETVSAIAIGVHCEDSLYWSPNAEKTLLDEFGPEFQSPKILHRLASHMYCHGL